MIVYKPTCSDFRMTIIMIKDVLIMTKYGNHESIGMCRLEGKSWKESRRELREKFITTYKVSK